MSAKKIPAPEIYTDKVEALLDYCGDFTRADFLALACAAADQADASCETTDAIHALITADAEAAATERERWAEEAEKDRARARDENDRARAEGFGEVTR